MAKIQCELCKEMVPIGAFRASTDGIDVTCQACGGSFFVPATVPAPVPVPVPDESGGSGMRCPKCDSEQPKAAACRSCGLLADRFDAFEREGGEASAELERSWDECLENWRDTRRHRALLERSAAERSFSWTASRYRQRLREQPGDTVARAQLKKLEKMAAAEMLSMAAARVEQGDGAAPYKNVVLVMIALLLVAGILGIYAMFKRVQQAEKEQTRPTPAHPAARDVTLRRPTMGAPAPAPERTDSGSPASR